MLESDDDDEEQLSGTNRNQFSRYDKYTNKFTNYNKASAGNLRRIQTCGCLDYSGPSKLMNSTCALDVSSSSTTSSYLTPSESVNYVGTAFRNGEVGLGRDETCTGKRRTEWRTLSNLYPDDSVFPAADQQSVPDHRFIDELATDHRVPGVDRERQLLHRKKHFCSVPALKAEDKSHSWNQDNKWYTNRCDDDKRGCESDVLECDRANSIVLEDGLTDDKENREFGLRPMYLIHPPHHVFGCADYDEVDSDEFFVSSGVVRASCPNIYEVSDPFSDSCHLTDLHNCRSCVELKYQRDDGMSGIKSYLTDNYDMHIRNAKSQTRNSEISSTASFGSQLTNNGQYNFHLNNVVGNTNRMITGLPPLQVPYYSCSSSRDGSDLLRDIDLKHRRYCHF